MTMLQIDAKDIGQVSICWQAEEGGAMWLEIANPNVAIRLEYLDHTLAKMHYELLDTAYMTQLGTVTLHWP